MRVSINFFAGEADSLSRAFVERIRNLRLFIIGAGAIGCELVKNLAMLGAGSGQQGSVTITDMDTIEMSNLNRQFLFRKPDIGKLKAQCAVNAIRQMNPEMNTVAHGNRVGPETESIYDDTFFLSKVRNS